MEPMDLVACSNGSMTVAIGRQKGVGLDLNPNGRKEISEFSHINFPLPSHCRNSFQISPYRKSRYWIFVSDSVRRGQ
jgi:hypothetical protein